MKVYGIDGDVARLVGPDGRVIEIPTARLPPGTKPGDEIPDSASAAAVSKPPPAASAEDLKVIDAISKKYAALAPHMSRAAVALTVCASRPIVPGTTTQGARAARAA